MAWVDHPSADESLNDGVDSAYYLLLSERPIPLGGVANRVPNNPYAYTACTVDAAASEPRRREPAANTCNMCKRCGPDDKDNYEVDIANVCYENPQFTAFPTGVVDALTADSWWGAATPRRDEVFPNARHSTLENNALGRPRASGALRSIGFKLPNASTFNVVAVNGVYEDEHYLYLETNNGTHKLLKMPDRTEAVERLPLELIPLEITLD